MRPRGDLGAPAVAGVWNLGFARGNFNMSVAIIGATAIILGATIVGYAGVDHRFAALTASVAVVLIEVF